MECNNDLEKDYDSHGPHFEIIINEVPNKSIDPKATLKKYLPNVDTSVVEWYRPDSNGWCGYCCIAYAFVVNDVEMADRMGDCVRDAMYSFFEKNQDALRELINVDEIRNALTARTRQDKDDWWLTSPDMLYIAAAMFQESIVYVSADELDTPLLISYKDKRPQVFLLCEIEEERFYHWSAFRWGAGNSIPTNINTLNCTEQDAFNNFCK